MFREKKEFQYECLPSRCFGISKDPLDHRIRSRRRDDANSSITSESPLLVDHYSRTCVRVAGLAMNLYSRGVNEGANRGRPHTSDFPQPQLTERGLGKAGGVPAFVFFSCRDKSATLLSVSGCNEMEVPGWSERGLDKDGNSLNRHMS